MEQIIVNGILSGRPIRDDRAGPDADFRPDERAELCPWADVCARRLRHLHLLRTAGAAVCCGAADVFCVTLAVVGALIERFLFAPVIKRSSREESTMLLAAGIAFLLDAVILLVFGEKQRGVPKIVDGVFNWDFRLIMPYDRILICVLAILSIVAFIGLMQYTKTGRALRALAQDRTAAQLMGVNVDRYSMIGFALGAMLAGLVGGLLVTITGVNLGMGGPTSIKAFMMVMIGGAGVISGAIAGGIILGFLESIGLAVLASIRRHHLPRHLRLADGLPRHPPARPDGQAVGVIVDVRVHH